MNALGFLNLKYWVYKQTEEGIGYALKLYVISVVFFISHLSPGFAGFLTVFINGVATEIPRGPVDIRAMFGQDVILVHSSGEPVPVNEYGISLQSLQMGESYFLVSFFFPSN